MTELSNAGKAMRVYDALTRLRTEYVGRPDIQHTITEAQGLTPSSAARLYDLIVAHDTPAEAAAALEA